MTVLLAILLAVAPMVIAPVVAWTAEMTAHEATLYEAAKAEKELTWYVAQYSSEPAEQMARAFTAKYPGITVNTIRTTGQVAFTRLSQDLQAGVDQCDVFSGTDIGHNVTLKQNGHTVRYIPENASKIPAAYQNADPDGHYHTTGVNLAILIYNTKFVAEDEAPKNWTDLADLKWNSKVALAHPGFSGTMGSWTVLMRKLYGWEFFTEMEKLDPLIGRSLNDPVSTLNSGERWVGIGPLSTAARSRAAGNPIGIVIPTDGAMLQPSASSILAKSRHPNAARLFMEFFYSIELSELIVKSNYEPLRPEVAPPPARARSARSSTRRWSWTRS